MKLNKASQETLTEIAKFLKSLSNIGLQDTPQAELVPQSKALTKALTQLRANIKEVEAASTTPQGMPEGMLPFQPPTEAQLKRTEVVKDESGHIMNLPTTPAESEEKRVVESGLGAAFTSAEAPKAESVTAPSGHEWTPVPEYEVAVYVSEAQVTSKAGLLGARQQAEGNFTMPLYRKK